MMAVALLFGTIGCVLIIQHKMKKANARDASLSDLTTVSIFSLLLYSLRYNRSSIL